MSRWILGALGCFTVACVGSVFLAFAGTAVLWQSDVCARGNSDRRRVQNELPVVTSDVDMKNDRFQPASILVEPGTTITWTNSDNQKHNVVFRPSGLQSELIGRGETFQTTLDTVGEFDFVCTLHGGMVCRVTVEAPILPTPLPAE